MALERAKTKLKLSLQGITPQIEVLMLSASNLLHAFEGKNDVCSLSVEEMRVNLFHTFHASHHSLPDYVFARHWSMLWSNGSHPLLNSLQNLSSQYFYMEDDVVCIRLKQFGNWQNVLSRVSALPILADFVSSVAPGDDFENLSKWVESTVYSRPFFHPYDKEVDDYIRDNGLNDSHIHLNGVIASDACWFQALLFPEEEIKLFEKSFQVSKVNELAVQVDSESSPAKLLSRLKMCRSIRNYLIRKCKGDDVVFELNASVGGDDKSAEEWTSARLTAGEQQTVELTWMALVIKKLNKETDPQTLAIFHFYLLVFAQYVQLLVQRDDAFGFQQFEKLTSTKLRSTLETQYYDRFVQLHGGKNYSQVDLLEGRFAPLRKWKQIDRVLRGIFLGYTEYLGQGPVGAESLRELLVSAKGRDERKGRKFSLSLVAHFIKQAWDPSSVPRHGELRAILKEQASALITGYKSVTELKEWLNGVDAASNELSAGSDVFAPIFRICAVAGLRRKTFHVGEDYDHLLSGLRHIKEAISLLELQVGDRIGHAIALGIKPQQWIGTMPSPLLLRRGEWMLDALICWSLLRDELEFKNDSEMLRCAAEAEALKIFGEVVDAERLLRFAKFRGLWPEGIAEFVLRGTSLHSVDDAWRNEDELIGEAVVEDKHAVELVYEWVYSGEIHKLTEELIPVNSDFCSDAAIIRIQQLLTSEIFEKQITIEALPTSNVRISQYKHIEEHHIFRWMGIPAAMEDGDPRCSVSLGSDDPGIFAVDIVSEFYHLFSVLVENFQLTKVEALERLIVLNNHTRQAIF